MRCVRWLAGCLDLSMSLRALLRANEILMARTQGTGVLPRELAINASVTGPMLRASGVNYDIRKVDHYGVYDRFNFKVPLGEHGDVYDRYMMRVLEMRETVKILEQALKESSGRADHGSKGRGCAGCGQRRARRTGASSRPKASWDFS